MVQIRFSRVLGEAGSLVTRLCQRQFGITRREWRLLACLEAHPDLSRALRHRGRAGGARA